MHRRLQIRKQAPQSKLRKLRPKGLLRLPCAGVAENANQPTFYVDPYLVEVGVIIRLRAVTGGASVKCIRLSLRHLQDMRAAKREHTHLI